MAAVAFNWSAPELWRRFTIALRRRLASQLGLPEYRLGERLRVSFAKVAEFQRRGVVHFHAIIRLDGPGDEYAPPRWIDQVSVAGEIKGAAGDVAVAVQIGADQSMVLRFGEQIDVRPRHHALPLEPDDAKHELPSGPLSARMVAGYIAKYATKAAEDFGLDSRIRSSGAAISAGLSPHVAMMILTAERLTELDEFAGMDRWLHMLGFRGHFTTKSRRFSVTLGALRRARREHREQKDFAEIEEQPPVIGGEPVLDPDQQASPHSTHIVGAWRFLGLGHATAGDALLAAHAHAEHLEALAYARDARSP